MKKTTLALIASTVVSFAAAQAFAATPATTPSNELAPAAGETTTAPTHSKHTAAKHTTKHVAKHAKKAKSTEAK